MMAQAVECPKVGECYRIAVAKQGVGSICRIERVVAQGFQWQVYASFIHLLTGQMVSLPLKSSNVMGYELFKKVEPKSYDKAVKMRDMFLSGLLALTAETDKD